MDKKFIDISEHNTILSFDRLLKSNLSGVIIKATEGTTYVDNAHAIYYDALHSKIPIGYYHFLSATSEPKTQALNFWNQIKNKEFQIIPCLDVERNEKSPLLHLSESYAKEFVEEFRALSGQDVMIYSNRCYIEEFFSLEFRQNHNWWVADYSTNDTPEVIGCKVIGWQYTEDCKNYDFNLGELDCNILVDEESFFINNIPLSESTNEEVNNYDSIITLQKELNFQCFTDFRWNELEEDGLAGALTLSACPLLSFGANGNITKWVQNKLNINEDGVFGEDTRQAVIEYQSSHCLKGDGIIGKETWKILLGMRG